LAQAVEHQDDPDDEPDPERLEVTGLKAY